MPAAPRVDPKTIFSPEEWAGLTRRSSWRGVTLIAHAWALIFAAGAMVVVWPNPATYLLAVAVIGARQLGIAILMHDAAHGALHPNAKANDLLATWYCSAPTGSSVERYRAYHLQHHKYTEQPEDPDIGLSRPFPISRKSFTRKVVRDISGQTFFKQRVAPTFARWFEIARGKRPLKPMDGPVVRFWLVNGAAIGALTAGGLWWVYPALWIVPMATWLPLISRLRNIAEHACLSDPADPFRHARTTLANPLERLFIAPYWVHFHAEHHMFMHLPCWNLPAAHRLLMAKGYGPRMEIKPSYPAVLREAAPA
jgi:fatty acid desaturase